MPVFIYDRHHAANVFLAHYHYRTQPCDPFKVDWTRRHATPFADMSTGDINFLQRTKQLIAERGELSSQLHKGKTKLYAELQITSIKTFFIYEDELYFISQMFEDDWQPRDSAIEYDDGTVNNVALREEA